MYHFVYNFKDIKLNGQLNLKRLIEEGETVTECFLNNPWQKGAQVEDI